MFKFFKEKIKTWVEKSKEKVEEEAEAALEEQIEQAEEKGGEEKEPEKKEEKTKKSKEERKEEREKVKEKRKKEKEIKKKERELRKLKKQAEKEEKEIEFIEKEEEKLKERIEKETGESVKLIEKEKTKQEVFEEIQEQTKAEEKKLEEIEKQLEAEEEEEKEMEKEPEEKEEVEPIERTAPTIEEIKKEKKPSFLKKLKEKFSYKLSEQDFQSIFEELELTLLENNVALEAAEAIESKMQEELIGKEVKKEEIEQEIKLALKKSIENLLIEPDDLVSLVKEKKPFVIVFFGVNGVGKTTAIAKVADLLKKNSISCVLAAADTFRAAAIEQLKQHADNLSLKIIKHDYGADPAAVAFDAIKHAKAHNIDVVLIDTAGRMHTSGNLLSEMEKICRVTDPDLKIFVAESISGNDSIQQAKNFDEAVGIDGTILTKADVDEKGGTAISVSYVTKKPILFLGLGQEYNQLEVFDKKKFIENLGL